MSSIKDHPLYIRMKQLPPQEIAQWVLGPTSIESAATGLRKETFRRVAQHITVGKAERTKYGFNSDTNGEIARAMEWAFQAGIKAAEEGGAARVKGASVGADSPDPNARHA